MKTILLVGCGNIGSRHLQGILKLKIKLDITVLDPSTKAIDKAKERVSEINFGTNHKLTWKKSLTEINENYNLCIIATNSNVRYSIFSELLKKKNKTFLIEKIVCQSNYEYKRMMYLLKKHHGLCWINTSRRVYDFYKMIKKKKLTQPILLNVSGGDLGLGSNTIHFLDLFSWICNSSKIKLEGENMIPKIFPNKRGKNFVEFGGTITGNVKNQSFITITSFPDSKIPIRLNFFGKNFQISINETEEIAYILCNEKMRKIPFKAELTSETTTKIVFDILQKNNCDLPNLEYLAEFHSKLFNIFNNHIYKITKRKVQKCPIT